MRRKGNKKDVEKVRKNVFKVIFRMQVVDSLIDKVVVISWSRDRLRSSLPACTQIDESVLVHQKATY